MSILRNTEQIIKRYLADFNNKRLKKPECCEVCGRTCKLTWHAKYLRKLITLCGIYHIPIKRLYCPACKHTFALLPEFIEKFHRYAKDVIIFALRNLKKFSYNKVADMLMEKSEICIEILTLYNWKKKFCGSY